MDGVDGEVFPHAAAAPERGDQPHPEADADLSAAVSYSLAQTVEARLHGIRNYTRLIRETQQPR